jgi:hypothetical protein
LPSFVHTFGVRLPDMCHAISIVQGQQGGACAVATKAITEARTEASAFRGHAHHAGNEVLARLAGSLGGFAVQLASNEGVNHRRVPFPVWVIGVPWGGTGVLAGAGHGVLPGGTGCPVGRDRFCPFCPLPCPVGRDVDIVPVGRGFAGVGVSCCSSGPDTARAALADWIFRTAPRCRFSFTNGLASRYLPMGIGIGSNGMSFLLPSLL